MLFKNKQCEHCKNNYDIALESCPFCGQKDRKYGELGLSKEILMTSIPTQVILFSIGFLSLMLLQLVFGIIFSEMYLHDDDPALLMLANGIPYAIVSVALIACLFSIKKPLISRLKRWKNYLWGIAFGAVLIGFSYLYSFLIGLGNFGDNNNQNAAETMIFAFPVLSMIVMGILAPVCEELTYRLGLFSFAKRINKYLAYVIVIIVFGLIHFDFLAEDIVNELVSLPQYIIAGLLFCLAYEYKGLPCCVVAHMLNNIFSIAFILIQGKPNA